MQVVQNKGINFIGNYRMQELIARDKSELHEQSRARLLISHMNGHIVEQIVETIEL